MNSDANLSRRTFLQVSAGSVLAASVGPHAWSQETQPAKAKMPTRKLGRTDLDVSILQMGGGKMSPPLIQRGLDLGVNFFDTAESYMKGRSELILGQSLAKTPGLREKSYIVTKGGAKEPKEILAHYLPQSLERLRTDHVDVWMMHGIDKPNMLTDGEWQAAAKQAVKSGKTRFFGFSCHGKNVVDMLNTAATVGYIDVIMLRYNFQSDGDDDLNRAIDAAYKAKIGLIAMKTQGGAASFAERVNPFAEAGFSKHQAVLKAVWKDERIASCVSDMPSLKILDENAAAATAPLTSAERKLIDQWRVTTACSYCPGGSGLCRRQCEDAMDRPTAIADTLRYLMYHDSYGDRRLAREMFAEMPAALRPSRTMNLAQAQNACPLGLPVSDLVNLAMDRLA